MNEGENKKPSNLKDIEEKRQKLLKEIELRKGVQKDLRHMHASSMVSSEILSETSPEEIAKKMKKVEELSRVIERKINKKEKSDQQKKVYKTGKMGRRDFIGVAGMTIAAAVGTKLIEVDNKKENTKIETIEGVKVPRFIFEKSAKGQEEYITKETLALIDQAEEKLKTVEVGFEQDTQMGKLKSSNVVLAIVDITSPNAAIETIEITPNKKNGDNDEGYQITIGENLGVATSFDVTVPEGRLVLAMKRKIERSTTGKIEDAIYSPYTPDLDIPMVRHDGFEYMVNLSKNAKTDLKKQGVKSQFKGESEIAPGVPLEIMVMLSLVEQTDPGVFARNAKKIFEKYDTTGLSEDQIKALQKKADVQALIPLVKKGLVVVGQNKEDTKKYAVSKVGASGILQLMPDTYKALEQKENIKVLDKDGKVIEEKKPLYPGNDLKPDFIEGAVDHKNAAKAAWLLLDSSLYEARNEPFFDKLKEDPEFRYKYLSACYNAGSKPIRKTIKENPDDWELKLPTIETKLYVRIFTALQTLFQEEVSQDEGPGIFSRIYKYISDRFGSKDEAPKTREIKIPKSKNNKNLPEINDANDLPSELRGGAASLAKQINTARKKGMEFILTMERLDELTQHNTPPAERKNPVLVPLPEIDGLIVINKLELPDPRRRYCAPETAKFLVEMAQASKKFNPNFEPLMINSGVRPDDIQQKMRDPKDPTYSRNATKISPHSWAATVDIAWGPNKAGYKGMSQSQMDWTQDYLIQKEKEGKIEATQEIGSRCLHFMVFKD